MESARLDVVTAVYSADLRMLKLQARSLARFADPLLIGTLHVIVNDVCFRAVKRAFNRDILPEYGALAARVRLHDYKSLWRGGLKRAGWLSQQALKLLAAKLVETEDFMILDAKNHFVRPFGRADVFASDGRLRVPMYRLHPKFEAHFERACAYFGLEATPDGGEALPTTTPYLMKRDPALALMAEIEEREPIPFEHYFMEGRPFTEFYLYYAYLLARHGGVGGFYEKRPQPAAVLFAGHAVNVAEATRVLGMLEDPTVYSMGVHREVLKVANPAILKQIHGAWARFGLVTDTEEQACFSHFQTRLPKWRRFLPF